MRFLATFIFLIDLAFAQAPPLNWQRCLGGTAYERGYAVTQTPDGGYVMAGNTASVDGDLAGLRTRVGDRDFYIVKLNASGSIQWQKIFGGTNTDIARSVVATNDGGYIVAGPTFSNDIDVIGSHGDWDYWVIKLNSTGDIEWKKCYGGSGGDYLNCIQQTSDGGYILAGESNSNNGDVTGNHGGNDYWVVKINSAGTIQWQRSLGGNGDDEAMDICQTVDGGFAVAGFAGSNNGDVSGNHGFNSDFWVVKLSNTGVLQWQKAYGGTQSEEARAIVQTSDGGFAIAGLEVSTDGDVIGNHGDIDAWVIKISSNGSLLWSKCIGGTNQEQFYDIFQNADGTLVLSGWTNSTDGDLSGINTDFGAWTVKLASAGNIIWQKCVGSTSVEMIYGSCPTNDGGICSVGYTIGNDGDVIGSHGFEDIWLVKLGGLITPVSNLHPGDEQLIIMPNPSNGVVTIKGKKIKAYKLYDLNGRNIHSEMFSFTDRLTLYLGYLPKGIYLIEVIAQNGQKEYRRICLQ